MPARSERIYIIPCKNGEPIRILPFPLWWNRSEFIKKYQRRELDLENPIDANYAWLLSSAEAIAWDKECNMQFCRDPLKNEPNVLEERRELESALVKASWVIVESYEWESGLD